MSNDSEKNLKNENVNENDNKESVKHHHHHHKHRHHKHGKKKNTKNLKIAILCTLFVVAILGLIYAFTADNFTFFDNKDSDKNSTKRVLEVNKGNTETQTESESETTTRNSEVKEIAKSDKKADENMYEMIRVFNEACKRFYEEKDYETRLLSVYSYLYDDGNKQEFTAKSVADTGFWIYDSELNDIAIHFIRPCDVNEINGAEADESEVLKVFTAMPTSEGVYISSADYKGGMISYEDYQALVMKYSYDHGEINIPKKDDEIFDKFLSLLRNLTGKEYDVKYMSNDDKYGIAIVGEKDDNAAIKGFLFMNKDGEWKVEGKKLEENPALRYSLNQMYPDMELGLLPDYNITDYGKIQSELTKFTDDFKAKGVIHDNDYPVVYSCATGRFLYIEMSSGKKVLGVVNNRKELETYTVENVNEAVAYMKSFEEKPPLFILKYY